MLIGVNHFQSDLQLIISDELFGCNQVKGESTERQRRNLMSDRIGSAFELQSDVLLGVKDIELIFEPIGHKLFADEDQKRLETDLMRRVGDIDHFLDEVVEEVMVLIAEERVSVEVLQFDDIVQVIYESQHSRLFALIFVDISQVLDHLFSTAHPFARTPNSGTVERPVIALVFVGPNLSGNSVVTRHPNELYLHWKGRRRLTAISSI